MFEILLILIFIRPFISSLAFPYLNSIYSITFLIFLVSYSIIKKIPLGKISSLKYPLILFCLALISSVVFSPNKLNSLKEVYKYITGLLLFFIATSLTSNDKIRFIRTLILTGFIISILAIYQYLFGFQYLLEYISKEKISNAFVLDYISRKRVFFPFVTPNTLGGYLATIIPLILTLQNKKNFFFLSIVSFALLLTKSLGAFLSLFLALGLYFYLQDKLKKRNIIFLLVMLGVIGLVFITRSITQKQHLQPIFSMVMRLNYWRDTLRVIKTSPLVGVGLGNFNLIYSRYAHNSYLQLWAEMGVFGIISILWLIIIVFKSNFKNNIKKSPYKNQISGLIAANTLFLIHNLFDFTFFLPETNVLWWVIFGLLISYANC